MNARRACPVADHDAIRENAVAYTALPLVGHHVIGDERLEMRRCPRCPSAISRPVSA